MKMGFVEKLRGSDYGKMVQGNQSLKDASRLRLIWCL